MGWCRGRAYSQDLRDRVLAGVADGFSVRDVADQFQVSPSYVVKAWQRLHDGGEIGSTAAFAYAAQALRGAARGDPGASQRGAGRDDRRAARLGGSGTRHLDQPCKHVDDAGPFGADAQKKRCTPPNRHAQTWPRLVPSGPSSSPSLIQPGWSFSMKLGPRRT